MHFMELSLYVFDFVLEIKYVQVTDSLGKQIEIKIIKNGDQCKQIWTEGQVCKFYILLRIQKQHSPKIYDKD